MTLSRNSNPTPRNLPIFFGASITCLQAVATYLSPTPSTIPSRLQLRPNYTLYSSYTTSSTFRWTLSPLPTYTTTSSTVPTPHSSPPSSPTRTPLSSLSNKKISQTKNYPNSFDTLPPNPTSPPIPLNQLLALRHSPSAEPTLPFAASAKGVISRSPHTLGRTFLFSKRLLYNHLSLSLLFRTSYDTL